MPPRCAPKAYRSRGSSFKRPPGIKKERGTQHGASRTIPSPAFSASEASLLLGMRELACSVLSERQEVARSKSSRDSGMTEAFRLHNDIQSKPDSSRESNDKM